MSQRPGAIYIISRSTQLQPPTLRATEKREKSLDVSRGFCAFRPPLPVGDIRSSADWTYRASAYTQFNLADPLTRYIPSSSMLDASITYLIRNWELGVYGTNLTNNLLISRISPDNGVRPYQPGDQVFIGRPRTVGLRIHYGF